jgi:hypothetical protein
VQAARRGCHMPLPRLPCSMEVRAPLPRFAGMARPRRRDMVDSTTGGSAGPGAVRVRKTGAAVIAVQTDTTVPCPSHRHAAAVKRRRALLRSPSPRSRRPRIITHTGFRAIPPLANDRHGLAGQRIRRPAFLPAMRLDPGARKTGARIRPPCTGPTAVRRLIGTACRNRVAPTAAVGRLHAHVFKLYACSGSERRQRRVNSGRRRPCHKALAYQLRYAPAFEDR